MRPKVEAELRCQLDLGILEKAWAAPIVPMIKPSEEIHLCGVYNVLINSHLELNQYLLSHPELLFAALNGGVVQFTKLDLSEAYLQIPLEEQSKKYLVINTHKGLYCFIRLLYRVASVPSIFQQIMD